MSETHSLLDDRLGPREVLVLIEGNFGGGRDEGSDVFARERPLLRQRKSVSRPGRDSFSFQRFDEAISLEPPERRRFVVETETLVSSCGDPIVRWFWFDTLDRAKFARQDRSSVFSVFSLLR